VRCSQLQEAANSQRKKRSQKEELLHKKVLGIVAMFSQLKNFIMQ